MAIFGKRSNMNLKTCHEDLQIILNIAIKYVDFSVLEGHRGQKLQDHYFNTNRSTKRYPDGKHNRTPSLAVDVGPYVKGVGIDWKNLDRFYKIVSFIKGIAYGLGIELRLGADWDGDFWVNDQKLHDLPHLELYKKLIDGVWVKYEEI